jgi:hypothetical protein
MKAPVLALTVAAAAFAASSIYLWSELRDERVRAAQVEVTTRELTARIAELEKARAHLAQNSPTPFSRSAAQNAPPALTEATIPEGREVWGKVTRAEPTEAMLKMMRSGSRAQIRRQYGEFAQQMGLSKELTSQLVDLLTEQQVAGCSETPNFRDESDVRRHFEELQRKNEAAIADLIGPDKAAQLSEYQKSLPARMEFEMLAQQLEGSDAPLSAEQRGRLRALYLEERSRVPQPDYPADMSPEYLDAYRAWSDDFDQRFRSQASRVLNSEQLNAFNEIQQAQKEMRDHNGGFGAVAMPLAVGVQGDVVTFSASGVNAAFTSGTAVSAPPPAAPTKEP